MAFQGWCCFATSTQSQNGAAGPLEGESIVELNSVIEEPDGNAPVRASPRSSSKAQGTRVKATGQVIVEVHRLHKESPGHKHRHERTGSHESASVLSPRSRGSHTHEQWSKPASLAPSPSKTDRGEGEPPEQPAEHLSEEERDTITPLHRELTKPCLPTSSPARTPRGMDRQQQDASAQGTPSDISNSSTKQQDLLHASPRGDPSLSKGASYGAPYGASSTPGQPMMSPAHTPVPMVRVTAADILTGAVNTQGLINVQRHGLSPFLAGVTAYSVPANAMSASPSHHSTLNPLSNSHGPTSYLGALTSTPPQQPNLLPSQDSNQDMAAPSPRSTTSHQSCTTPSATPTHALSIPAYPSASGALGMPPTHHRSYSASTQDTRTMSSTSPSSIGYTTTPTSRPPPRVVTPGSRSNLAPGQLGASGGAKGPSSTGASGPHGLQVPERAPYHHHASSMSSIPAYSYNQPHSPGSSGPNSRLDATFETASAAAQRLAQQAYLSSARAQTALSRHANAAARNQRQQQSQSQSAGTNPYGFAPVLSMSAHALAKATQGQGALSGQQGSFNNNSVRSTGSSRRSGAVQQGSRAVTARPYQTSVKVGSASSRVALSSLLSRGSNMSTTSTDRNSLISAGMDFRPRWR